jgi:hypothetical protein
VQIAERRRGGIGAHIRSTDCVAHAAVSEDQIMPNFGRTGLG